MRPFSSTLPTSLVHSDFFLPPPFCTLNFFLPLHPFICPPKKTSLSVISSLFLSLPTQCQIPLNLYLTPPLCKFSLSLSFISSIPHYSLFRTYSDISCLLIKPIHESLCHCNGLFLTKVTLYCKSPQLSGDSCDATLHYSDWWTPWQTITAAGLDWGLNVRGKC